jgi:hypothetical protein
LFDTLDNLSEGSVPAKFGESGANYKFASYIYGPGPYISYENEVPSGNATPSDSQKLKEFVGRDKDDNNKQYSFTEDQIPTTILTNTDDPYLSADFVLNGVSNELQNTSSARGAYTAFVSNTTDANLGNNKFYPSFITTQIPFVVNPDDFTFSYYNPLVKHTFQQNDYLLSDITPVQKQIANTNAWSNFSKHVDTSSNFKDKDK